MGTPSYLQVFRERWGVILASTIIGVSAAALATTLIPPTYSAKATMFLCVKAPHASLSEISQFSLGRVASYPDLAFGENVLHRAAEDVGHGMSAADIARRISVSNPDNTVLVEVVANGGTGKQAADIANAVASSLGEEVMSIESNLGDATRTTDTAATAHSSDSEAAMSASTRHVQLKLQAPAQVPTAPSAPQPAIILGLGLVAGLAGGTILALMLSQFDTRIRSSQDIRRVSGLPVFGQTRRRGRSDPDPHRPDPARDGFDEAILNLSQANGGEPPRLLLLTPTAPKAAPLRVRMGFARAYADSGREVVLLENSIDPESGDARIEDLVARPGIGELIAGDDTHVTGLLRPIDVGSDAGEIWALPRGVHLPPSSAVDERLPMILGTLTARDHVTIVQASASSRPLRLRAVAPFADVIVVVARYGKTREAELSRALTDLRLSGVQPLGVILTDMPARRRADMADGWRDGDFSAVPRRPLVQPRVDPYAASDAGFADDEDDEGGWFVSEFAAARSSAEPGGTD